MTSRLVFDDKERVGAWVAERVEQSSSWGSFYSCGVESDGKLVAGVVFNNFNGHNCTVHIAVEKTGRYLASLLEASADYAFRQCKLKRLTGLVDASNVKAFRLDKHIGFEHEFTMRSAGSDGGDLHVLVMWPDKCRWWKTRGAQ